MSKINLILSLEWWGDEDGYCNIEDKQVQENSLVQSDVGPGDLVVIGYQKEGCDPVYYE